MEKPNLFSIATKELSQDAFITWLLQWSDPQYKTVDLELNQLGTSLLKALIASQDSKIADNLQLQHVKAGRQRDKIDVWVEVNNDLFIIIEDKTDTKEHGKQIETYVQKAHRYRNKNGEPWRIVPIYLKTGNECINSLSAKVNCGIFTRQDFLKILPAQTKNDIVRDFSCNLQMVEDKTNAYLCKPISEWDGFAVQGFYCDLQRRFKDAALYRGGDGWAGWGYVANQAGGFQGLCWHWQIYQPIGCSLFLQIESNDNKQKQLILKGEAKESEKLGKEQMYKIYDTVLSTVKHGMHSNLLNVNKAGKFKGGRWVSIATITQEACASFISTDKNGLVDMAATTKFLFAVEEMLSAMCGNAN